MKRTCLLYCALTLSACGSPLRQLYLDERFGHDELADIRSAVAEVNKLAYLISEDALIEIAGSFRDGNGRFEQGNVDNECDELYRIAAASECQDFTRTFEDQYDEIENLYGFYTGTDIGILVFNLDLPDRPPFRHVVMHELGHYVGMHHVTGNSWAVMAPTGYGPRSFTQADKEEFCLEHGCDPD